MSQVVGSGNSKAEARSDAGSKASAYCNGGDWEEESCSYNETSPGYWQCMLWFHCK